MTYLKESFDDLEVENFYLVEVEEDYNIINKLPKVNGYFNFNDDTFDMLHWQKIQPLNKRIRKYNGIDDDLLRIFCRKLTNKKNNKVFYVSHINYIKKPFNLNNKTDFISPSFFDILPKFKIVNDVIIEKEVKIDFPKNNCFNCKHNSKWEYVYGNNVESYDINEIINNILKKYPNGIIMTKPCQKIDNFEKHIPKCMKVKFAYLSFSPVFYPKENEYYITFNKKRSYTEQECVNDFSKCFVPE